MIYQLKKVGLSTSAIARCCDCSRLTVRKFLNLGLLKLSYTRITRASACWINIETIFLSVWNDIQN